MFEREGWKEFRTLDGLCRMAGVGRDKIGAVVAKELVDNALDGSSLCIVGLLRDDNGFFVQDNGPGIDPDKVADLFSIGRQQKSTKFVRLPTRGGLRQRAESRRRCGAGHQRHAHGQHQRTGYEPDSPG